MAHTTKRRPGTVSFVRFKLGLSQQQLADILGVSRSMIAMIETGKRKLSGPIATIYEAMCDRAATVNPDGYTLVKRGRKPARPRFSFVTNYDGNAGKDKTELFVAALEQKRQTLLYQQTGLQFRKKAMEEQTSRLSDQLDYVTAMLKVSRELLDKLPGNKWRDKYELREAIFYAKQVKLKQQLKKCGPVGLLTTELQVNMLEGKIKVADNTIAGLLNNTVMTENVVFDKNNCPDENCTRVGENIVQYGPARMIAA